MQLRRISLVELSLVQIRDQKNRTTPCWPSVVLLLACFWVQQSLVNWPRSLVRCVLYRRVVIYIAFKKKIKAIEGCMYLHRNTTWMLVPLSSIDRFTTFCLSTGRRLALLPIDFRVPPVLNRLLSLHMSNEG